MHVRYLLVHWTIKTGQQESAVIPVPATKEGFARLGKPPRRIGNCEDVRRWTLWADLNTKFVVET